MQRPIMQRSSRDRRLRCENEGIPVNDHAPCLAPAEDTAHLDGQLSFSTSLAPL